MGDMIENTAKGRGGEGVNPIKICHMFDKFAKKPLISL